VRAVIVSWEARLLVTTTDMVLLEPTVTVPNERLAGDETRGVVVTPVPLTASSRVALEALLVKVTSPLVQSVLVGEKTILTSTLFPAPTTMGRVAPEIVNSELVVLIEEMVALIAPEFVSVTSWVSDSPEVTEPNRTREGEQVSC